MSRIPSTAAPLTLIICRSASFSVQTLQNVSEGRCHVRRDAIVSHAC